MRIRESGFGEWYNPTKDKNQAGGHGRGSGAETISVLVKSALEGRFRVECPDESSSVDSTLQSMKVCTAHVLHWTRFSSSRRHGLQSEHGFKNRFPNQNSLDQMIIFYVIFPTLHFFLILVLFFGIYLFFETGSHCGWPRMHCIDQTSFELTEMSPLLLSGCWDQRRGCHTQLSASPSSAIFQYPKIRGKYNSWMLIWR